MFGQENHIYLTNFTNDIERKIDYKIDNGFEDLPNGEAMIYDSNEIIGNAKDYSIHIDPENAETGESLPSDIVQIDSDFGYFENENNVSPQIYANDIQIYNNSDDIEFHDTRNIYEKLATEEETSLVNHAIYDHSDDLGGRNQPSNKTDEDGVSIDVPFVNKSKTYEIDAEYNQISHNSDSELEELKNQLINLENMMLKTKEKMKDLYSYKNEYAKETSLNHHSADFKKYNDGGKDIPHGDDTTLPNELNSDPKTDVDIITDKTSGEKYSTELLSTVREAPETTTHSVTFSSEDSTEIFSGDNTTTKIIDGDMDTKVRTDIIDTDIKTQPTVTTANQEEETTTMTGYEEDEVEKIPTIPSSLKALSFVTLDSIVDRGDDDALKKLNDSDSEVHEKMPEQLAMTALEEENSTTDDLLEKSNEMFYLPAGHGLLFGFKLNELEKFRRTKLDIFHNSEIYQNV